MRHCWQLGVLLAVVSCASPPRDSSSHPKVTPERTIVPVVAPTKSAGDGKSPRPDVLAEIRELLRGNDDTACLAGAKHLAAILDVESAESAIHLKRLADTKRQLTRKRAAAAARAAFAEREGREPGPRDDPRQLAQRMREVEAELARASTANGVLGRARAILRTAGVAESGEEAAREVLGFYECTRGIAAAADLRKALTDAKHRLEADMAALDADARAASEAMAAMREEVSRNEQGPTPGVDVDAILRRYEKAQKRLEEVEAERAKRQRPRRIIDAATRLIGSRAEHSAEVMREPGSRDATGMSLRPHGQPSEAEVAAANKHLREMLVAFEARRTEVERDGEVFGGFLFDDTLGSLVASFKERGRAALIALRAASESAEWSAEQRCGMVPLALLVLEFSCDAPSYDIVVRMLTGMLTREKEDARPWVLRHITMVVEEGLFAWSDEVSPQAKALPWYKRSRPDLISETGKTNWAGLAAAILKWWETYRDTLVPSAIRNMHEREAAPQWYPSGQRR